MNQKQRDYVEQFLQELQSGKDPQSIISSAYLDDWAWNEFDFFVFVDADDFDRYSTTKVKAAIERALLIYDGIVVNMYEYNTPRGGNGWKFSGIVTSCIGDYSIPIRKT